MSNTSSPGWTDEILIREIRAGGQRRNRAWEYIYKAWRGYYLAPVLQSGGTPEQADEVLAQVVIDMERQIVKPDFNLHSAVLKAYFTEGLKRAWSKSRMLADPGLIVEMKPEIHQTGQRDSVEQEYIRKETLQRLDELLTRLGEKCKTVLTLFAKGYSMREIADAVGFENEQSAKNTKVNCHRKLIELTENLAA